MGWSRKPLCSTAFHFGAHALRREVANVFFVRLESDMRFTFLLSSLKPPERQELRTALLLVFITDLYTYHSATW